MLSRSINKAGLPVPPLDEDASSTKQINTASGSIIFDFEAFSSHYSIDSSSRTRIVLLTLACSIPALAELLYLSQIPCSHK